MPRVTLPASAAKLTGFFEVRTPRIKAPKDLSGINRFDRRS
jgi:hypothetical protein